MNDLILLSIITMSSLLFYANAAAEEEGSPCATGAPIMACVTKAVIEGDALILESTAESCSVVQWTLDDEPRTSLLEENRLEVRDAVGFERRRDVRRRVSIQSCVEVRDERLEIPCETLLEEEQRVLSSMPSATSTSARVNETAMRRSARFAERFARHAPVGCCAGLVCAGEHGIERMYGLDGP